MQFFKLQATGNDFVFVFDFHQKISAKTIQNICDRHYGVGAEGFVILNKTTANNYEWQFYNPDGKEANMCGNAARAATLFLLERLEPSQEEVTVRTRRGTFSGKQSAEHGIVVSWSLPDRKIQKRESLFGGRFPQGYLIDTGVPHCVIPLSDLSGLRQQSAALAPLIYDSLFGADGANLTFFMKQKENHLQAMTLERGVNDFTLSCGTGVIAAALVAMDLQNWQGPVTVTTPGGELSVELQQDRVSLAGPAEIIYEGKWL